MGKNQRVSKSAKAPKKLEDLPDISYDTPELTVDQLVEIGFTHEEATGWLRKKYIQKLFQEDKRR